MKHLVALPKATATKPGCRPDHGRHQAKVVHPRHVVTTMMFTDIVDSTGVLAVAGDDVWVEFMLWHDATLRHLFRAHGGREVKQVGDGFFAVFDDPGAAVTCALAIVGLLATPGPGRPPVGVRVGVHRAEVVRLGQDYAGRGVHEAARIAALAGGGEVLVSAGTVPTPGEGVVLGTPKQVRLRGLMEPLDVLSITRAGSVAPSRREPVTPRDERLTPQERRVAEAVAGGASNKEAAAALYVSAKTVEFHLSSVYRKLGLTSRSQLARYVALSPL